jgi:hypothetical protein
LVALEIIFFRFREENERKSGHAKEVLEAGRALLEDLEFEADSHRDRSHIASVARTCLEGADGVRCAETLCAKFGAAVQEGSRTTRHYDDLFQEICAAHPFLALDHFFSTDPTAQKKLSSVMGWQARRHTNPLERIPVDVIIAWCQSGGIERFCAMAAVVWMFVEANENSPTSKWSTIARALIDNAPQPGPIIEIFGSRIKPSGWSGSIAAILRGRLPLLEELLGHQNAEVSAVAGRQIKELKRQIDAYQKWEHDNDHDRDERSE